VDNGLWTLKRVDGRLMLGPFISLERFHFFEKSIDYLTGLYGAR
jgi:hypothetical protein